MSQYVYLNLLVCVVSVCFNISQDHVTVRLLEFVSVCGDCVF